MKLSNTKVQTYRRCPKKYEFGYVLKLKQKVKALPLERGSWLHTLLEVHYAADPKRVIEVGHGRKVRKVKVGADWRRAHKVLTTEFYKLFEEEREHLGDLPNECARIMKSYLYHYRDDEDREVIATELDEVVTLPNGDKFNFIIDQVYATPEGHIWLKDYKTVSGFMDSTFMLIDAQLARYFWGFARLPKFKHLARDVRGVEFDEVRTKAPTIPEIVYAGTPREALTKRTNLDTDVRTYLQAIKKHGLDPEDYKEILAHLKSQPEKFFRRTILPRDKPLVRTVMRDMLATSKEMKAAEKRGYFPRTPDKSCTWMCDFLEPCMAQAQGADIEDIIDLKYDRKEDG